MGHALRYACMSLRRTPLRELHVSLGAKPVGFHGWELPLSYRGAGIIAEHVHTRESCSLFDVSHMRQFHLRGEGTARALERILPMSAAALKPGRGKYTFACRAGGGIVDDMIVANDGDCFHLVCNAARGAAVSEHFRGLLCDGCGMEPLEDRALLALQGPKSEEVLARHVPGCRGMRFMDAAQFEFGGAPCRVSRSGYTGEDGFELSVVAGYAMAVAEVLLDNELCRPAGLGARDTLRTEAGLCLYGSDIDESVTPAEAGLGWAIPKSARKRGSFVGAEAVLPELEAGPERRLVGLLVGGKSPVRQGTALRRDGEEAGTVTSGSHSPTLGRPVALAMVGAGHAAPGTVLAAELRGKEVGCEVAPLPFVAHRYKRPEPPAQPKGEGK